MATTSTKKLKTEVRSAIKRGMAERGWEPSFLADAFIAPETMVEPPLSVEWSLSIESYSHGGASVSGIARTHVHRRSRQTAGTS